MLGAVSIVMLILGRFNVAGGHIKAQLLTPDDMMATFGDGPCYPCRFGLNCNAPIGYGASECVKCDQSKTRWTCCNLASGQDEACLYNGEPACVDYVRKKVTRVGELGTCDSCNSVDEWQTDGKCTTMKHATGEPCFGCS